MAVDADGIVLVWNVSVTPMSTTLQTLPLGGGTPTPVAELKYGDVDGMAIDASSISWVNRDAGTVMTVARTGGKPTTLATGLPLPESIAIDASFAYVACAGDAAGGSVGSIVRIPRSNGAVETLATGLTGPGALVLDATSIYWREIGRPNPDPTAAQGSISKLAK